MRLKAFYKHKVGRSLGFELVRHLSMRTRDVVAQRGLYMGEYSPLHMGTVRCRCSHNIVHMNFISHNHHRFEAIFKRCPSHPVFQRIIVTSWSSLTHKRRRVHTKTPAARTSPRPSHRPCPLSPKPSRSGPWPFPARPDLPPRPRSPWLPSGRRGRLCCSVVATVANGREYDSQPTNFTRIAWLQIDATKLARNVQSWNSEYNASLLLHSQRLVYALL